MLVSLSRSLRRRTNVRNFMFVLGLFCISNVGLMLLHKQIQAVSSVTSPVLDLRQEGYRVDDVKSLLRQYGAKGRQWYIYFEALDLSIFMWSYAALLSMMLSAGTSIAPYEFLKLVNLIPWTAAMADSIENTLIIAMLVRYPDLTNALAPYAAAASKLKWQLLFVSASAVGGVGLYCIGVAAKRASQHKQPKHKLEAAGGAQQQRKQPKKQQ